MMRKNTLLWAVAPVLALALAPMAAFAADMPSVDDVIAKYIEATGGEEAMGKLENRVTKGTLALPDMGMTATMTTYVEPPNMYSEIMMDAFGTIERGVSDGVAWENNPMQGIAIHSEGPQRAQMLNQASFNEYANWKEENEKAEVVEEADVDGETCYKVVFTPKEGDPTTMYFSKESGLAVKSEAMAQGMTMSTTIGDYIESDGVKIPSSIRTEGGQFTIEITIDSVEHNTEIPEGRFDLPEDVKKLMEPAEEAPAAE